MRKRAWWLCAGLLWAWPARAQAEAALDPKAEAGRLFEEGKQLFAQGETARACEAFARSAELDRQVGALLNLARCYTKLGRTAAAHRGYLQAAAMADANGQTERARKARVLAKELEGHSPLLRVQLTGAVAGQTVAIDGETLPPEQVAWPRMLDPGQHEIASEAPGRSSWRKTVALPSTGEVVVTVPALQPSGGGWAMGPLRLAGFVVGGVGAAAAVAGGVLGGLTLAEVADAEDDPALCPNRVCTPAGREQIDGARDKGIGSTVLLSVGAAALGAGVLMIVLGDDSGHEQAAAGPWIVPGGAGWSARWRF